MFMQYSFCNTHFKLETIYFTGLFLFLEWEQGTFRFPASFTINYNYKTSCDFWITLKLQLILTNNYKLQWKSLCMPFKMCFIIMKNCKKCGRSRFSKVPGGFCTDLLVRCWLHKYLPTGQAQVYITSTLLWKLCHKRWLCCCCCSKPYAIYK